MKRTLVGVVCCALAWAAGNAGLPPVPVPAENPITEEKRILGKILFWDEQLSSDDTVSCGTCHDPGHAGADARAGDHPGFDELFGTDDDVNGSPGVVRTDAGGAPIDDPLFGFDRQVTRRSANMVIMAAYAPEMFWDGRAGDVFLDPDSGEVSIATGGALENQAIAPPLSGVEMAREGRGWSDVAGKLASSAPLAHATDFPADVSAVLDADPSYGDLFLDAFGGPEITAERIAFAIATYERTLVPDQTPWDLYIAGDEGAMTPLQQQGWMNYGESLCPVCHLPPRFTNNEFRNVGVRPWQEDPGLMEVTGMFADRGKFKTPTLRNVGLRDSFMHNGRLATLEEVMDLYENIQFPENIDSLMPISFSNTAPVIEFMRNGLTDPRVANELFPFDHPTMHGGDLPVLEFTDKNTLGWPALQGAQSYRVYRGDLAQLPLGGSVFTSGTCLPDSNGSDSTLSDSTLPASGTGFFYLKTVIDGQGAERGAGATSDGTLRQILIPCS